MENVESIVRSFGFKLISSSRSRTGIVCKTDKGVKELKKIYYDEKTVLFEDAVKRHLKQRGFDGVGLFNPTLDGTPFFNCDEATYVLEDFYPCQTADLTDKATLKKAVSALSKIHNKTEDFDFGEGSIFGADLIRLYEKRITEAWRVLNRLKKRGKSTKCDYIVEKNAEGFILRAREAVDILSSYGYGKNESRVICHNCYKGDNIKLTAEGEVFVSGFSKCAIDIPSVDLAEFIRRYFKDNRCSSQKAYEIYDIYCEGRFLDKNETAYVYASLMYPAKFFKLCNSLYNRRKTFVSSATEDKLERCCLLSLSEEKFLKELGTRMLN